MSLTSWRNLSEDEYGKKLAATGAAETDPTTEKGA